MHVTATFHEARAYRAVFVVGHPRPSDLALGIHVVQLGNRRIGTAHVSIPLNGLYPERYSLFIELVPQRQVTDASKAGTWVYFVLHAGGKVDVGRIVPA